jgi:hypothetical protein
MCKAFGGRVQVYKAKYLLRAIRCNYALVSRLQALRFYSGHAQQQNIFQLLLKRTNVAKAEANYNYKFSWLKLY